MKNFSIIIDRLLTSVLLLCHSQVIVEEEYQRGQQSTEGLFDSSDIGSGKAIQERQEVGSLEMATLDRIDRWHAA